MPVKKFNSFEEAATDLWIMRPNEAYYEKVRQFLIVWSRLLPHPTRRSLLKFKNIHDAGQCIDYFMPTVNR